MPPKAKTASAETSAEPKFDMTSNDLKLLRAMVIHMEGTPSIDYESLRETVGYAHTKNAKSAVKNLLEKMKRQANAAAAAKKGADKTATPEADESDEEQSEESPKKSPVKKSTRAKKSKPAEVVDDGSEEEESAKKTLAAKKTAPAKKGVGKTTAPKKASAGGPKPAVKGKGKGKKATKVEQEADQMEEDVNVEAEDDDVAQEEDEDNMKADDDIGKSLDSLLAPPTTFAGKSVASQTLPATAVMTGPPLYININGEVYTYTPYDVHVAQGHGVTLQRYLEWKKDNLKYDDYLDPVPYSL